MLSLTSKENVLTGFWILSDQAQIDFIDYHSLIDKYHVDLEKNRMSGANRDFLSFPKLYWLRHTTHEMILTPTLLDVRSRPIGYWKLIMHLLDKYYSNTELKMW